MRRLLYIAFTCLMLSVVASCIDRPDCVLDETEMVDVLVDVHRAEGLLEMQIHPGLKPNEIDQYQKEVIAAVLQKHGVTRVQYDSSLMWYAQHLKLLTRVYGHVDERLQEEYAYWGTQVTESQLFSASAAGDSVELWSSSAHLVLDAKRHDDVRFWEFPSDSNFVDGDTLRWQFAVHHLLPGQKLVAALSLTEPPIDTKASRRPGEKPRELTYEPLGHDHRIIAANGSYQLVAHVDSVQPFGTAILSLVLMADSTIVSPVFIDSISLLRTHPTE